MKPFEDKLKNISKSDFPTTGPWAFLRDWESPITEEKLEVLSSRGKKDAKVRFPPSSLFSSPFALLDLLGKVHTERCKS